MNRTEIMQDIAHRVEEMVRRNGRHNDIKITFENLTEETISRFTGVQQKYYGMFVDGEFFFIWETSSNAPDNLLCVVPTMETVASQQPTN